MREQVLDILKTIADPELGVNIVDLGLVQSLEAEADRIDVTLIMTSPACPQGHFLADKARRAIALRFPCSAVAVQVTASPPWSPARMSGEAKRQLGWRQ